ncbi:hypothetical protein PENTCL1PPCAC_26832, partial [Pristionchus entomophagus]
FTRSQILIFANKKSPDRYVSFFFSLFPFLGSSLNFSFPVFLTMDGSNVNRVDHWRKKAFDLSSSDRLGFVLSRAMDLMGIVVKDGTKAKNLHVAVRSLEMERKMTMEEDEESDSPLREIVYGMCETLGLTMKSIIDERNEETRKMAVEVYEEPIEEKAITNGNGSVSDAIPEWIPSIDEAHSSLLLPKEEEMDEPEEDEESFLLPRPTEEQKSVDTGRGYFAGMTMQYMLNTPTTSSSLQLQMRQTKSAQERIRDHGCDLCGKKFTSKKSMENHQLVHKGERKHECSICGWKFMRRSDLLRHLKNVDHSKPVKNSMDQSKFMCDICGVAFYRLADKSNHVKSLHTDQMDEDRGEQ